MTIAICDDEKAICVYIHSLIEKRCTDWLFDERSLLSSGICRSAGDDSVILGYWNNISAYFLMRLSKIMIALNPCPTFASMLNVPPCASAIWRTSTSPNPCRRSNRSSVLSK